MPALWDEPFGLTLIEALASGTPVLGTRRGALPEIVSPDVGALGDSVDELVALRPTLDEIDPAACRAQVERHFTHHVMAAEYVRMFERVPGDGDVAAGTGARARVAGSVVRWPSDVNGRSNARRRMPRSRVSAEMIYEAVRCTTRQIVWPKKVLVA